MVVIQARMGGCEPSSRYSMSIVLDDGEIHHFFALADGVHHSSTRRFRGRYEAAINRELARPNAEVIRGGLCKVAHLASMDAEEDELSRMAG
jgi:hypothetical protein